MRPSAWLTPLTGSCCPAGSYSWCGREAGSASGCPAGLLKLVRAQGLQAALHYVVNAVISIDYGQGN